MLHQYPKLLESATEIKDQILSELIDELEPFLGTEDGSKRDHPLFLYGKASSAISRSDKLTRLVKTVGNHTTRAWKPNAIHYNRVIIYAKNLYRFVDDEGDAVIDRIMERVIELT
jgi:hypothetical protein